MLILHKTISNHRKQQLMGTLDNIPPCMFEWNLKGENGEIAVFPVVIDYKHIPPWNGSVMSCPSDEDWYGYTVLEWEIKQCVFFPDGDKKIDVEIVLTKKDFSQEYLDKIEQRVLEFCLDVSRESHYDDSVMCRDYERE